MLRFTDDEHAAILRSAQRDGTDLADWLRLAALDYARLGGDDLSGVLLLRNRISSTPKNRACSPIDIGGSVERPSVSADLTPARHGRPFAFARVNDGDDQNDATRVARPSGS
jgi:hypothetical protein